MCILNSFVESVLALLADDALHITDALIRVSLSKGRSIPFHSPNRHTLLLWLHTSYAHSQRLQRKWDCLLIIIHFSASEFPYSKTRGSPESPWIKNDLLVAWVLLYKFQILGLVVVAEKKDPGCFQNKNADEACVAVKIEHSRGNFLY